MCTKLPDWQISVSVLRTEDKMSNSLCNEIINPLTTHSFITFSVVILVSLTFLWNSYERTHHEQYLPGNYDIS